MRRAFLGIVPALSLVLASFGARADDGGNASAKLDGEIRSLVQKVDPARIQANINALSAFHNRNACATGFVKASEFALAQFKSIGFNNARFDDFSAGNVKAIGCVGAPTPDGVNFAPRNVVAWIKGRTHPERVVVIGGHLDTRSFGLVDPNLDTTNLLRIAGADLAHTAITDNSPGSDDSGAQSSLVLELARILSKANFDNTILFATFGAEEEGTIGSANLAGPAINPQNGEKTRIEQLTGIPGAHAVAMLNNDISGGDSNANTGDDFSAFRLYAAGTPRERTSTAEDGTTDNTSPARGLMRFIANFGVPAIDGFAMRPELREDRPGRGSDQSSFLAQGVPAVRFIESHECSSSPVDNACPATDPNDPGKLTSGRPCPSPFAALPRTDPRHNCLHTNFVCTPANNGPSCTGGSTVIPQTRVCQNDDERAHGIVLDPATPAGASTTHYLNEGCVDDRSPNPFHNFQRQHAPNDNPAGPTPTYEAKIAQVMGSTLGHLARAPNPPTFTATGDANSGVTVTFAAAAGDKVENFIVAARSTKENFHSGRVRVRGTSAFVTPAQLGIAPGQAFFISVAAESNGHHESLFGYPEFRCDATACAIPAGALNITGSK
ncbi:MAG: M28 family peptidase [Myxococcales bacterium]